MKGYKNLEEVLESVESGDMSVSDLDNDLKKDLISYILDNELSGTGCTDDADPYNADLLESLGYANVFDLHFIRQYGITYNDALSRIDDSFIVPYNPYGISLDDYSTQDIISYFNREYDSEIEEKLKTLLGNIDCNPDDEEDLVTLIYKDCKNYRQVFDKVVDRGTLAVLKSKVVDISTPVNRNNLSSCEKNGYLSKLYVEDILNAKDISGLTVDGSKRILDMVVKVIDYCCSYLPDETASFLNRFADTYPSTKASYPISKYCSDKLISNGLNKKVIDIVSKSC